MGDEAPAWLNEDAGNPFSDPAVEQASNQQPPPPPPAPVTSSVETPSAPSAVPSDPSSAPSWLSAPTSPPAGSSPSHEFPIDVNEAATNMAAGAVTSVAQQQYNQHVVEDPSKELGEMPKAWVVMRVLNVCVTILLGGAVVAKLQNIAFFDKFDTAILAVYIFLFATILCCFEVFGQFKVVAEVMATNFGFLYTASGRLGFMLMAAMLVVSLSTNFAYIVCGILCLTAGYNVFCLWKYPAWADKIARLHGAFQDA